MLSNQNFRGYVVLLLTLQGMRTVSAGPVMARSSGTVWDSDSFAIVSRICCISRCVAKGAAHAKRLFALSENAGKTKLAVWLLESPSKLLCALWLTVKRTDSYMAFVREDVSHEQTNSTTFRKCLKGASSCFERKLTKNHSHKMLSADRI